MHNIIIPDFQFDSLVGWTSVDDIMTIFPFLTPQEATLACRFQRFNSADIKAAVMFNIICSMYENCEELSDDQILFITELLNWNQELKNDIVEFINTLSASQSMNIVIEI